MKGIESSVEPLLADLRADKQLPSGAEDAIRRSIAGSPYLKHLLANAADSGQIGRIAVSYGHHNGGHFQEGADGNPPTIFISASNFQSVTGARLEERLTEVLGHETMHGILAKERAAALRDFKQTYSEELIALHDSRSGSVNLTEPVRTLLDKGRQDEALAEVSGLRALDSRFRALNPTLDDNGLEAMLASRSLSRCIRAEGATRSLADGISYDALAKRPNNESVQLTKAVEQCFYDGTGTLGRHGDSDYRNYYGTYPLSVIGTSHAFLAEGRQPPAIRIDLHELGLDPKQLERNGLDFGSAKILPVGDFGKGGLGWVELKNTGSAHTISPPTQSVADMQSSPTHSLSPADQALLDQIRSKVEALDKANGRTFDDTSERMSTSLLAAANDAGITRADHVVLSRQTDASPAAHNIFVVQGAMSDPASLRTHMATAEAAQRPVQESLNQVEAIGQRQAREQADMQRTQEQQQRVWAPSM